MAKVYVLADKNGFITDIEGGSTVNQIENLSEWTLIDEGEGYRYEHPQSNYFDSDLYDDEGRPSYQLINGKPFPVRRSQTEPGVISGPEEHVSTDPTYGQIGESDDPSEPGGSEADDPSEPGGSEVGESDDTGYPIVSIVADDGIKSDTGLNLTAWLDEQEIPECFAIITDQVGQSSHYTLSDLISISRRGNEIFSHSATADDLNGNSNVRYYAKKAKAFMGNYGFNTDFFAYPNGNNGVDKESIIAEIGKLYRYGLNVNVMAEEARDSITGGFWNQNAFESDHDRLDLARLFVSPSVSMDVGWIKTTIDTCIQNNGWLILSIHDYGDDAEKSIANLKDMIAYLQQNGVAFRTLSDAAEEIEQSNKQKIYNVISTQVVQNRSNLLHNWYFKNPVNQRDVTGVISDPGYFIDRWKLISGTVELTDAGLVLNGTITQILENPVGDTTTATVLTTKGIDLAAGRYQSITDSSGKARGEFSISATGQTIVAAKLELGNAQTLAMFTGKNWRIADIPDYSDELAKCQQYYVSLSRFICPGYLTGSKQAYMAGVPLPVPMRRKPVIMGNPQFIMRTIADYSVFTSSNTYKTVADTTIYDFSEAMVTIAFRVSKVYETVPNNTVTAFQIQGLTLSCEL